MDLFQEATPLSVTDIEALGIKIREILRFTSVRWLPVPHIIEHMLPTIYGEDFSFRVEGLDEMGSNHAYADPDGLELVLRSDVYERMVAGLGRDRMTAMHEMSHLILHPRQRLYRRMREEPPPPYRDPEWQAKCLAGATMMPAGLMLGCSTIKQVVDEFGVSADAASYRMKQIVRGATKP
jgi:hypothetical protein